MNYMLAFSGLGLGRSICAQQSQEKSNQGEGVYVRRCVAGMWDREGYVSASFFHSRPVVAIDLGP